MNKRSGDEWSKTKAINKVSCAILEMTFEKKEKWWNEKKRTKVCERSECGRKKSKQRKDKKPDHFRFWMKNYWENGCQQKKTEKFTDQFCDGQTEKFKRRWNRTTELMKFQIINLPFFNRLGNKEIVNRDVGWRRWKASSKGDHRKCIIVDGRDLEWKFFWKGLSWKCVTTSLG